MTKKEFFKLLKKHEQGQCSKTEEQILLQYCEEVQVKNFQSTWSLTEKEKAKLRVSIRITDTIKKSQTNNSFNKKNTHPIKHMAAIFVGLLGIASIMFYYLQPDTNTPTISNDITNEVTIKFDDNRIEILKNGISKEILDKNRNIIGVLKNRKVIFNQVYSNNELTYNTLSVPYGQTFELQLSDGTSIHLNAGSTVKFPTNFIKGMKRNVFVTGEVYLEVAKDSLHPFVVTTSKLNVTVLGTKFNVNAYTENESSEIVLVEGKVSVSPMHSRETILLTPGLKGSLDNETNKISVTEVNTSIYTRWQEGILIFKNTPFKNIAKTLERRYNKLIIMDNEVLNKERFTASFRNASLEQILERLSKHHNVTYQIRNDTITIK